MEEKPTDLSAELESTLRAMVKECLRVQPSDIAEFCLDFLSEDVARLTPLVEPGLRGEPERRAKFLGDLELELQQLTRKCLESQPQNLRDFCRVYFKERVQNR